jgi:hypothetical protein
VAENSLVRRSDARRRPSLWLAASVVASGWAALYSLVVWILQFTVAPVHDDVRQYYVAAEAGLRYGWSSIYDQAILRELSSSFPQATRFINDQTTFASTPFVAWVFAPLTVFPEPVAYVLWVLVSLAALVFACWITVPYTGLARVALVLLAIGLWPVLLTLYFGQPTLVVIALVAGAWRLAQHDRPLSSGAVLAIATALKPQVVILLPVALLVSARYRVVGAWALGCALLGAIAFAGLGASGLAAWWHAVRGIQDMSINTTFTLAQPLGKGLLTYFLWGLQGVVALAVAFRRRREIEVVFAAGILGTIATATYLHNSDYCMLLVPAWLVLRTSPPLWHRWWLLTGVVPMQLLLTGLLAGPQLVWDAAWLVILSVTSFATRSSTVESLPALHAKAVPAEVVMSARRTD